MQNSTIPSKYSIFISYDSTDSENFKIARIVNYLESQIKTIDRVYYWERDTKGGQKFLDYMLDKIEKSNFMLFLCSQESLNSKPVTVEIGMGLMAKKEMMAVFREKQDIPEYLKDFRGVPFNDETEKDFINTLKEIFTKITGENPQKTDYDLLFAFSEIMEVSLRVKRKDVARHLGISEDDLFRKLIDWKDLGYKIDDEMIVINDVRNFTTSLEEQRYGKEIGSTKQLQKKVIIDEDLTYANLTLEEKLTFGYFLLSDELYVTNITSKDYYFEPFNNSSWPPDCNVLNERHNDLILSLYPEKSIIDPKDVITTLIAKNLLILEPERWSATGKTHYPSFVTPNMEVEKPEEILDLTTKSLSQLIQSIASNENIMMELYLIEQGIPEQSVQMLIGNKYKQLIKSGLNNRYLYKDYWRVIFNPDNKNFNMIENLLNTNASQLITKLDQIKQKIKKDLNELERKFLSVISSGITIIDKQMGTNYSAQTLRKYEAKMKDIHLNYKKKVRVLVNFTGESREVFNNIYEVLTKRGIIWLEKQGFSGYQDVHQIVVKSFIDVEPVLEIKKRLNGLHK